MVYCVSFASPHDIVGLSGKKILPLRCLDAWTAERKNLTVRLREKNAKDSPLASLRLRGKYIITNELWLGQSRDHGN